ncbi:hypothetical protein [Facklamia miroungae]|uniref:Membrane domain of glycerophosphoryl diester phosphodiesterase n=1 Tax=Facklamia miroungae TaxID=120956 RepID=A0A1G7RSF6_9LACT|nr:hypothetical protein [Facklamia miroungae]NKZ29291.1 hypothetical protein [Facklamia miroungae]SDG13758.1 hypothetical protein SAMN05421791_103163 [Facklamia miroungae]
MLSDSVKKLKQNYGFFIGVLLITLVGTFIINWILGMLNPANNTTEEIVGMINPAMSPDQMMNLTSDMLASKYTGWGGVITLITMILTSFLSIMQRRAFFQKLNFPEMRIADSAFFHTSPLKIITLPVKSFFATLLASIAQILIIGIIAFILFSQLMEKGSGVLFGGAILLGLIYLIMEVFFVPIGYLIAYDVDGKYNFWSTFTKSLSIGKRHFGRIVKTIFVRFIIVLVLIILPLLSIFFTSDGLGPLVAGGLTGLLALLAFIFWIGPLVEVYLINTLNKIFELEY